METIEWKNVYYSNGATFSKQSTTSAQWLGPRLKWSTRPSSYQWARTPSQQQIYWPTSSRRHNPWPHQPSSATWVTIETCQRLLFMPLHHMEGLVSDTYTPNKAYKSHPSDEAFMNQDHTQHLNGSGHQNLPNTSQHQGISPGTHSTITMDTPMLDSQPKGVPSQNWRQNCTSTTLGDTTNLTQWLTHYDRFPEGRVHSQRTCHPQHCQMFLQVTTISKISNHMGTHLLPEAIQNGQTSLTLAGISTSNYTCPHQPNPGPSAWKLWTHALQAVCTKPGLSTMLIQHLGDWYPTASTARTWYATYHPNTQTATIAIPNQNNVSYLLKSHIQSHMYYDQTTREKPLSPAPYPVTISKQCRGIRIDTPITPIPIEEQPDIQAWCKTE